MSDILYEQTGRVVTITLNRPEILNAFNDRLNDDLNAGLKEADRDDGVNAVVVTGAGRAFSSGHDLKAWAALPEFPHTVAQWRREFEESSRDGFFAIWEMKTPTVAAVNRDALGQGCNLAISLDIALADETARLGYPEISTSTW